MLINGAQFAVDQGGTLGELGQRRRHIAELARPVVPVAGVKAHLVACDGRLHAVAIELHFE
jgi:hypothetical protein